MSDLRLEGLSVHADLVVEREGERLTVTSADDGRRLFVDVPSDDAAERLAASGRPAVGLADHFVRIFKIPVTVRVAGKTALEVAPGSNLLGKFAGLSAAIRPKRWGLLRRLAWAYLKAKR